MECGVFDQVRLKYYGESNAANFAAMRLAEVTNPRMSF